MKARFQTAGQLGGALFGFALDEGMLRSNWQVQEWLQSVLESSLVSAQPYLKPPTALDRTTMGKYEVLCRLAAGGMAEIFLACQRGLAGFRKVVVLKSILPDVRGEDDLVRMFLAEAKNHRTVQPPAHRAGVRPRHRRRPCCSSHGVRAGLHAGRALSRLPEGL